MPNESNRRQLKALIDLLNDGHSEITMKAAKINALILESDTDPDKGFAALKVVYSQFGLLLDGLRAQGRRVKRVRKEIEEIRNNLKTK